MRSKTLSNTENHVKTGMKVNPTQVSGRGKKGLPLFLALVLTTSSLAGCAGTDAGNENASDVTAAVTESSEGSAPDGSNTDTSAPAASGADTSATGQAVSQEYFPVLPDGEETSSIFVEKIDGIGDDFIRGMDISSLLSEEASGVKYYDSEGNEQDLLKILADAGINCIRVRVWNDPFDSEGHGYGGGNCTAETAAELGARAAKYGMGLCVDFHYSDFWADPNKQMRPKDWGNMRTKDQKQKLYDYTVESLHTILDAGANVTMVQIGNETNNGLSGRTSIPDVNKLLISGSEAVRHVAEEYGRDISVAVHYTAVDDKEGIERIAERLKEADVDYDIFGVSYYPYWHGSMENLTEVLKNISSKYGKKTCVMETSYMYTTEDGDTFANSVSEGNVVEGYPVSVQGQASCVRDVCAAAFEGGALGVFYWEGAWLPVNPSSGTRQSVWEEYGSGWASSYSVEYDPDDAGRYYGGNSWDNQAFFDFEGHQLDSLNVFKYLKYGAKAENLELMALKDVKIELTPGDELVMPDMVDAVFNDPSQKGGMKVEWDPEELAAADVSVSGEYRITGHVELAGMGAGKPVETDDKGRTTLTEYGIEFNEDGTARVMADIIVANVNQLKNASFEEDDRSMWTVTSATSEDPTDYQEKSSDAYSGDIAFHFWSKSAMEFSVEQTVTVDKAGIYSAGAWMQGGDFNSDADVHLYVKIGDKEFTSDAVVLDGWVKWKNPVIDELEVDAGEEVCVGAYVKCNPEAWATFDDFSLKMK